MRLKKVAALVASSAMAMSPVVPAYAEGSTEVSQDAIEDEQGKDEEFDEEYGLEDSDTEGDPYIDSQDGIDNQEDADGQDDGEKDECTCCKCGCCIEEEEPEEEDDGYICEECRIELTKEEMESNAKELASMLPSAQELKKDVRFSSVFPSTREELESGDVMVMSDATYIYVILEDEIYTWYEVRDGGINETPNLRFSNYATFYRVNKSEAAFTVPDGIMAYQGDEVGSVSLPYGFTWQKPDKKLDTLGNVECLATYMPDNLLLYKPAYNVKVTVQVKKVPMGLTYPESRYTVSYSEGLTLSSILLPPGWSFEDPDTALDVGSKIYTAVFEKDEDYDYTMPTDPVQVRVDVDKSAYFIDDIHISVPAGTVLGNGVLPKVNNGTLEWDVSQKIATISSVYTCHFVPDDISRYRITQDIPVHVNVESLAAEEAGPGQTPEAVPTPAVTEGASGGVAETPAPTASADVPEPTASANAPAQEGNAADTQENDIAGTPAPSQDPEGVNDNNGADQDNGFHIVSGQEAQATESPSVTDAPEQTANPGGRYETLEITGGALTISPMKGNPATVKPASKGDSQINTNRPASSLPKADSEAGDKEAPMKAPAPSVSIANTIQNARPNGASKLTINAVPAAQKANAVKKAGNAPAISGNKGSGVQNTITISSKSTLRQASAGKAETAQPKGMIAVNSKNVMRKNAVSNSADDETSPSYPATVTINSSSSSTAVRSFTVRKGQAQPSEPATDALSVQTESSPANAAHASSFSSGDGYTYSSDANNGSSIPSLSLGEEDTTGESYAEPSQDSISAVSQGNGLASDGASDAGIVSLADGEIPKTDVPEYNDKGVNGESAEMDMGEKEEGEEDKTEEDEEEEDSMPVGIIAAVGIILIFLCALIYFLTHKNR